MIRARILPGDDDQVGLGDVFDGDRTLADADGVGQGNMRRLVAHVRAVRQIIGAEAANHQLVQECGLVAGPPRGVEHGLVGTGQPAQFVGDQPVRVVPFDGAVVVLAGPKDHRVRQPALLRQPVLGFGGELGDRVPLEEVGGDDALGCLLGDGLSAVFAEFGELASAVFLRPRAAGAVEAFPLVQPGQRGGRADRAHLLQTALQRHQHRLDACSLVFPAVDVQRVLVVADFGVPGGVTSSCHNPNLRRLVDHLHHAAGHAGDEQPAGVCVDAKGVGVLHGRQALHLAWRRLAHVVADHLVGS